MYQLDWAKGWPDSWYTLFLGVSERMFPEEISISVSSLSKDHPPQCRWALADPLRVWIEQKGRGWVNLLSLPLLGDLSPLALGHWHSWFLEFQTLTEVTPPALLGLCLADHRSWDSASIITWANFYNKFPLILISILLVLFLWRSLTNTWRQGSKMEGTKVCGGMNMPQTQSTGLGSFSWE